MKPFSKDEGIWNSIGLLILRVLAGALLMWGHGWPKLSGFSQMLGHFPDPIGLGVHLSLALSTFAEFFCAFFVIVGLLTRFVCIPIVFNLLVAGLVAHGADPWSKKELAFVYMVAFLTLIFTGPGRFSLDRYRATRTFSSKWR
jgi:putative oxidoreductase